MDERPMTGMLDEDALLAGAVQVDTTLNLDGTTTIEWTDINGNIIRRERGQTVLYQPTLEYTIKEEDLQRLRRVFCFGEWDTSDDEDEPEIKEDRGGALDEFLDGFKPQETTPERSDEQK